MLELSFFKEAVKNTETFDEVSGAIKEFRSLLKNIRPR